MSAIILIIVSILVILEGLFIAFFTQPTKRILKSLLKNTKKLREYGLIEIIIGFILLATAIYLWNY